MEQTNVLAPDTELKLPKGFHEWCAFDVTDSATEFNYANIRCFSRTISTLGCNTLDSFLNFIRDVWYNLDGFTKVITTALSLDNI